MALSPLLPGDPRRAGPYAIRARLGSGGMGQVFLADGPRGERVAVKLLHPHVAADTRARARLARELRTLSRVRGPHLAEVVDADVDASRPFLVTRYVPGPTLDDRVAAGGPLEPEALLATARGLATALVAVHAAGVVHRDLKPGNVICGQDGPTLLDFGVASAVDESALTSTGEVWGTPAYLAPEQAVTGQAEPASDVHALGATLVYAATGAPLFGTGRADAVLYRVVHDTPRLPVLAGPLQALLPRMLAREPARRPSAAELLEALGAPARAAERTGVLAAATAGPTVVTTRALPPPRAGATRTAPSPRVAPQYPAQPVAGRRGPASPWVARPAPAGGLAGGTAPSGRAQFPPAPFPPAPFPPAQSPSAQSPSAQSPSAQSPSAQSPPGQSPPGRSPSGHVPSAAPVPAVQVPPARHLPAQSASAAPVTAGPWAGKAVGLLVVLALTLGALVAPLAVPLLTYAVVLPLHDALGRTAAAVLDRRLRRGPRPTDGLRSALGLAGHLARAVVGAALRLPLLLLPAAALAGFGFLAALVTGADGTTALRWAAAAVSAVLGVWLLSPGRQPPAAAARAELRRRAGLLGTGAAALVLVVVAWLAFTLGQGEPVWFPLAGQPSLPDWLTSLRTLP